MTKPALARVKSTQTHLVYLKLIVSPQLDSLMTVPDNRRGYRHDTTRDHL